jgi:hypothetical protein
MRKCTAWLIAVLFTLPSIAAGNRPVTSTTAYFEKNKAWTEFRNHFRYHIQLIGVKTYADQSVNIIIAEPPNRVLVADIQKIFRETNHTSETQEWRVGVDGWVKDMIITATEIPDFQLKNCLSELNELIFYTNYKADFFDLGAIKSLKADNQNLNYQVSAAELNKWFVADKQLFFPPGKVSAKADIGTLLTQKKYGTYYSVKPGFVVWLLPSNSDISGMTKLVRRFALDADLLIGAISNTHSVAIIGRERKESIYVLTPLRTESVMMLAASNKTQLAQSYERNSLFAGKLVSFKDWAPIYLSDELINTEYGSLLNVTDQMLKSWSQNGEVKYQNFDYPNPAKWAFARPVFDELNATSLIYNWNTRGVGYSINMGGMQMYAVNRTGSLPVTYLPDSTQANSQIISCEDKGYNFFSGLNDPNLIKVGQYAFLYQLFTAHNIKASPSYLNKLEPVKDVLLVPSTRLLKQAIQVDNSTEVMDLFGYEYAFKYIGLQQNLKRFYRLYGEEGLSDIARAANDRNELYKIDKVYALINKLIYEENELVTIHDSYVPPHNELVKRHNYYAYRLLTASEKSQAEDLKRQIDQYRAKMNPLLAEIKQIRVRIDALLADSDERLALKMKILNSLGYCREALNISSRQRDSLALAYSRAWASVNKNNTWIKTPSIVVSQNTRNYFMTGGHNIDPRIERFIVDNAVAPGKVKVLTQNGRRIIKINPNDVGRINSRFMGNMRYVEDDFSSSAAVRKIESGFAATRNSSPVRDVDAVFADSRQGSRGYTPKNSIGWNFDENASTAKVLTIRKDADNYYYINDKKTSICYNIRESVEEYMQKNPGADAVVEFKNFSEEEVRYFSENIASRFAGKSNRLRWRTFRGERETITSAAYDFSKKQVALMEDGVIRISIPKRKMEGSAFIRIAGIAKNLFKTAQARIEKVFRTASLNPTHDVASKLLEEFKAAGISVERISVSLDDCGICINITGKDVCRS